MAGRNAPRGDAVEQFEVDMHEADKGEAAAEPTFRVVICDAEGLGIVGLRVAAGDESGDAAPEGVRLAKLTDQPGGEIFGLHGGQLRQRVRFDDGSGSVLRMER